MKPLEFKTRSVMDAKLKHETTEAEIFLYEEIGYWGVDAKMFADTLKEIGDVDRITLRLHSPGGSAWDGLAMFNNLVQHPAIVTVRIDGIAASAASIVAMAGDRIEIAENARIMIHEAWVIIGGNADDLRAEADVLDGISGDYAKTYARRRGLEPDEVRALMKTETWFLSAEAVAAGFADEVLAVPAVAASIAKGRFQHTPAALLSTELYQPPPPKWRLAAAERETLLTQLRKGA
jgi:ATP-dependent protease ClpP protease subunit